MSKPKFTDISGFEYNALVTFAEISEKNNPMGRFDCIPVYVPPTKNSLSRERHTCAPSITPASAGSTRPSW